MQTVKVKQVMGTSKKRHKTDQRQIHKVTDKVTDIRQKKSKD